MPLLVKYTNDGTAYVPKQEIQHLLSTGKIEAFKRSSGDWVNPKVDPIRGNNTSNAYTGPNRRSRF